jgi:hypothetical protein
MWKLRLFQKLLRCASYFECLDHQRVVTIFTNWFEQVNYVQIEFFKILVTCKNDWNFGVTFWLHVKEQTCSHM